MDLYFLRHGIAAERGDPRYKDDSLRPLTAQGQKKMYHEARGMQRLGLKFDTIICSPYLRAKQTAEIVAQSYKLKNKTIHFTKNLLPPASIKELLQEIHAHYLKSKSVLLVGHEPHLTEMISSLLKAPEALDIDLKKGGLCYLSIDRTSKKTMASLIWLLTPTQVELMAR